MDTECKVRVAVNIRPLVTSELLAGCSDCVSVVVTGKPHVHIGKHAFTFDYVFGRSALPSYSLYDRCVSPLVDALFQGYNGTVFAYGQTGAGKTYTMGTDYNGDEESFGVIPKVMETIYSRVDALKDSTKVLIRVSFIEIFKEDVFDLLDPNPRAISKADGMSSAKPARVSIQIRETVDGEITLVGVTEQEVRTKEEMTALLLRGLVSRATGSTLMNSQSSRSHAIFTISMEQKRTTSSRSSDVHDDILSAKLHLVDLAGSESAKRTGAHGVRLHEGIQINKGLLALGKVISALGDDRKRKEGGHVPYRDSKLTRLLQDSLGGNSKTVMIACVSPANTNAEETLNTLKYANRARNIKNKAVINRDPMAAQMQRMRDKIEVLQSEVLFLRGESTAPPEELQILKHKNSMLEASNAELKRELQQCQIRRDHLAQKALNEQMERDKLVMKIKSARAGKPWNEIDSDADQDFDLVKGYASKIQELEGELIRIQTTNSSRKRSRVDFNGLGDDGPHSDDHEFVEPDVKSGDFSSELEVEVKEREHSSLQEQLDQELKELDKRLEQKEAEMKRFGNTDTSVPKQHYEMKVQELETKKRVLQKKIEELRHNLASSGDGAQKPKRDYLQKLNRLEAQVGELKKKQDAQVQLLRQKQKSDEAAKQLHDEIHKIKTQKVQLQQKIKQESEQFKLWKASREKEVLQLKKVGRRNEYEMQKLFALNQKQKMVLQRKTEEAALATKRLKESLESKKTSLEYGVGDGGDPEIQQKALMQTIKHELEVTVRVHEVRAEHERQMEERARMAKELAELKELAQIAQQGELSFAESMSPGARNAIIFALENMLATSSSALVTMASHLSEAEELERAFSGKERWNQVRNLDEAKHIMNFIFNLASSSRCNLKDREVDCRDKDSELSDLKEKVVELLRQINLQKAEIVRQEKLLKCANGKQSNEANSDEGYYGLRPEGLRNSVEDMDTPDPGHSYMDLDDADDDDDDIELYTTKKRKRSPTRKSCTPPDKEKGAPSGSDSLPVSSGDLEGSSPQGEGGEELLKCANGKQINEAESDESDEDVSRLKRTRDSLELHHFRKRSPNNNPSGSDSLPQGEGGEDSLPVVCCSCSKNSQCKTSKCDCRAAEGCCGMACKCDPNKCANRGSMKKDGAGRRKPLSDFGNTLMKSPIEEPTTSLRREKEKQHPYQKGTEKVDKNDEAHDVHEDDVEGNGDEKCDDKEETCDQDEGDDTDGVDDVDDHRGVDDETSDGIGGNDAECDDDEEETCDQTEGDDEDGVADDETGDGIGGNDAECDDDEDDGGGDKMGGDDFYDPKHDHVAKHLLKKVQPYEDRGSLHCKQCIQKMDQWKLQDESKDVRRLVEDSVLYKLKEASYRTVSKVIVSAFVERWHPETNTFHMPFGEMTITLDDVHHMLGIPVVGKPMRKIVAKESVSRLLGIPEKDVDTELRLNSRSNLIRTIWIINNLSRTSKTRRRNVSAEQIARGYLLVLLGCTIFQDSSGDKVHIKYLSYLEDLGSVNDWAWGAAALAYFYHTLGKASTYSSRSVYGYLTMLEAWVYEHFCELRQKNLPEVDDGMARTMQWRASSYVGDKDAENQLKKMRAKIDNIKATEVEWTPYRSMKDDPDEICWYWGCLVIADVMEPYYPDRVLRQFGRVQDVPRPPIVPKRCNRQNNKVYLVEYDKSHMKFDERSHLIKKNERGPRAKKSGESTSRYEEWYHSTALIRLSPQVESNVIALLEEYMSQGVKLTKKDMLKRLYDVAKEDMLKRIL